MNSVVITQPMFFPWVGLLEQIMLSDTCVIYDNTAFSKGSFTNRVQIPLRDNVSKWLTLPLKQFSLGTEIRHLQIRPEAEWKNKHLAFLKQTYKSAPYKQDMLDLVQEVYDVDDNLAIRTIVKSMRLLCRYYNLAHNFQYASDMNMSKFADKSQKVLDMVIACQGKSYITGHGASNYLDHSRFDSKGISIYYMDYMKNVYPQVTTTQFNPYVSALDLIANMGPEGRHVFSPQTLYWKDFKDASQDKKLF